MEGKIQPNTILNNNANANANLKIEDQCRTGEVLLHKKITNLA